MREILVLAIGAIRAIGRATGGFDVLTLVGRDSSET